MTPEPTSTRRKFAAEFNAACAPLTRTLADRGGHVGPRSPQHTQAVLHGHPSALPPYDHTADPDLPVLPRYVRLSLSVLLQSVMTPGSVPRPTQIEAAEVVAAHFSTRADHCDPHGIARPDLRVVGK